MPFGFSPGEMGRLPKKGGVSFAARPGPQAAGVSIGICGHHEFLLPRPDGAELTSRHANWTLDGRIRSFRVFGRACEARIAVPAPTVVQKIFLELLVSLREGFGLQAGLRAGLQAGAMLRSWSAWRAESIGIGAKKGPSRESLPGRPQNGGGGNYQTIPTFTPTAAAWVVG